MNPTCLRVALIDEQQAYLRLVVALLVSLTSLVLIMHFQPFVRRADNTLAMCSNLLLTILFIASLLMRTFDTFRESTDLETAQAELGFRSRDQIVACLIFANIAMFLFFVAMTINSALALHYKAIEQSKWSTATLDPPAV